MVSVQTVFISPTNFRGARYKAIAGKGGGKFSLTVQADDSLGCEANHYRAARLLIERLGWFHAVDRGDRYGQWVGGDTPRGYVFVCNVGDYAILHRSMKEREAVA